jgi:triosephosphate isomerase
MEGARKYFVGANWKCNGSVDKNRELINDVINKLDFDTDKVGKFSFEHFQFLIFASFEDNGYE